MLKDLYSRQIIYIGLVFVFLVNTFGPLPLAQAQDFHLPAPGVMVHLSPTFNPPVLKGIKVHPDNPFRFDFILDKGDSELSNGQLKDESTKLIKYFLASLTIPEKDLWVNLSPYEKDRIIPNSFGLTEMGRDLLAEDYMLKQITASLIYPEDEIGKKFWKRIYEEAAKKFDTTNISVNTFNKVWIVPEKAVVYENAKAGTAYVVESKLKVMLEWDYLSLEKHEGILFKQAQAKDTNQLGSQIVREVIIPELTKEVNEDKNFVQLRQVCNSLILATWYKKKIKDSILAQVYEDKNKVAGINIKDPQEKERIYERYLQAFKKGAYNYIKEQIDPTSQQIIPRKYFSGGFQLDVSRAMTISDQAMNVGNFIQKEIVITASLLQKGLDDILSKNPIVTDPETIVDYFNRLKGVVKVVDMGTMDGVFMKEWRKKYPRNKIIGFDLMPLVAIEGYVARDVTESGLLPESVDIVTINMPVPWDYLNKLTRLFYLLKEANRILKPNGKIYITSDNKKYIQAALKEVEKEGVHFGSIKKTLDQVKSWYPTNTTFIEMFKDGGKNIFFYELGKKIPLVRRPGVAGKPKDQAQSSQQVEDMAMNVKSKGAAIAAAVMTDNVIGVGKRGGIDLTSDKALSVQNNGQGIKFHIDPFMLKQFQNAPGFVPVIINIQPMTDIRIFLGLNTAANDNYPKPANDNQLAIQGR